MLSAGCSTPAPTPASTPAPSADVISGDGTFAVGTDVQPGTYRSAGDRAGTCEWSRQSSLDGADLFDNRPGGPQTVQILAGDESFLTSHCQDWHRVR